MSSSYIIKPFAALKSMQLQLIFFSNPDLNGKKTLNIVTGSR